MTGMLANYQRDEFGVIHQVEWSPKKYDDAYLSYYEGLRERTIKLGYQRLGWVLGLLNPERPQRLLEIGYGLGTFLEAAELAGIPECAGCDIAEYPLPDRCTFHTWEEAMAEEWDVVGLFDVLEHIPDLSFLGRLRTQHLAIAVPWCHWKELGDDWFANWRMLLPDEHLHHFDPDSLTALLDHYGFDLVDQNTFEDGLRLREGELGPNILSAFFTRRSG